MLETKRTAFPSFQNAESAATLRLVIHFAFVVPNPALIRCHVGATSYERPEQMWREIYHRSFGAP